MSEWLAIAAVRGSLVLAAAALVWRLLPETRPGLRRKVALAVLVGAVAAPWFPRVWVVASPAVAEAAWSDASFPWSMGWLGLWIAGVAAMMIRDAVAAARLVGIIRRSERAQPPDEIVFDGAIRRSHEIDSPCIAGFFRPVLLVPLASVGWSVGTWRCVVEHEGQHLRQRDAWMLWLGRAVVAFYWWQPLAHWLLRQLELETEIGCDSAVVNSGTPVREYAEVLMALANPEPAPARVALRMSEPSRLRVRLGRVLALSAVERCGARWRWLAALGLLVGVGGWVSVCGLKPMAPDPWAVGPSRSSAAMETEAATRLSANPFPGD